MADAKCHLISASKVRTFILDTWADMRPGHDITQVSAEALETLEADLRRLIRAKIRSHPSMGKTFRP
jgi:hypothetical protein